jgi:hypothetical protein
LGSFYFVGALRVGNILEKLVGDFAEKYKQEDITFKSNRPQNPLYLQVTHNILKETRPYVSLIEKRALIKLFYKFYREQ